MGNKVNCSKWGEENRVSFICVGCGELHALQVEGPKAWQWNGSLDKPTLSPSILMRSGHYAHTREKCWCGYNAAHPEEAAPFRCAICHFFLRDGKIEFLSDCTHELRGQTVEMPDWEEVKNEDSDCQ